MKALVFQGRGSMSWTEVPMPELIDPTDVLVRVDTTTICGTDLHILRGDVPAVTPGECSATKRWARSSNRSGGDVPRRR